MDYKGADGRQSNHAERPHAGSGSCAEVLAGSTPSNLATPSAPRRQGPLLADGAAIRSSADRGVGGFRHLLPPTLPRPTRPPGVELLPRLPVVVTRVRSFPPADR